MEERRPLPAWRGLAVPVAIVLLGFCIVAWAYWPGVMIDDARWQYQQAVDNAYEDWHPPLMAWIWHHLMTVQAGPGPMLLLQLAFYWGGVLLVAAWAYRTRRPRLAVLVACAGWLPAPLALLGSVTKDCLMAGVLTTAVGLILWLDAARTGTARVILGALSIVPLLAAAALRVNGFIACLPLALAVLPTQLTRTKPRLLVATLACGAVLFLAAPLFASVVKAEDTDPKLSLIIFDLGGITEHTGVSQFPDMNVADPVAANHACYDAYQWDGYSSWARKPCPLNFDKFQSLIDDDDVDPVKLWLHAIAAHPAAYTEHRLTHYNESTWFMVPHSPPFTGWTASVPNPWNYQVRRNALLDAIDATANAAARTPLGWPIFWIAAALAGLIVGLSARIRPIFLAIAASPMLYGLGFLPLGVATGMRYYFWSMAGAALGILLIGAALRDARPPSRAARILAAAIVTVPTVLAIAARLIGQT